MKVTLGARLTWNNEEFLVIGVDYRHARLRSLSGEFVREVIVEELVRSRDVVWHDRGEAALTPTDLRMLDDLPEHERVILDAWTEQLEDAKRRIDEGEPPKTALADLQHALSGKGL